LPPSLSGQRNAPLMNRPSFGVDEPLCIQEIRALLAASVRQGDQLSSANVRKAVPAGLPLITALTLMACQANQRGLRNGPVRGEVAIPPPSGIVSPRPEPRQLDAAPAQPAPESPPSDSGAPSADDAAVEPERPPASPDAQPPDMRPAPPPPSAALARGLSIYLPLDDGMGARPRDLSGLNQMARLLAADPTTSWSPDGYSGKAVELGGGPTGGYLVIESSPSLIAVRTEITLAAWLLLPQGGGDGVIVARRAGGTGGYLFLLRLVRGRLNCQINSANAYRADASSPAPVPRDEWVHVAMTFDTEQARLFVGGKPAGSAVYMLGIPPDITPIVIGGAETERPGGEVAGVTGRLAARLDEVTIYDRSLPPGEVAQLAAGVRPRVNGLPPSAQ
jgi:hypothetical protein